MLVPVLLSFIFASGAWAIGPPVDQGVHDPQFVDGQYFVMLKDPAPGERRIIPEPDYTAKDKPGFVESTTPVNPVVMRELEAALGVNGEVVEVYDAINAAFVHMDVQEAERLRHHPLVKLVEQSRIGYGIHWQGSPGWGLDRIGHPIVIDGLFGYPDNINSWWHKDEIRIPPDGYGNEDHWLYVIDSGIDFTNSTVMNEFIDPLWTTDVRAINFTGISGLTGQVCKYNGVVDSDDSHGTAITSVAIGQTYGAAKRQWARIINVANSTVAGSCSEIGWCDSKITSVFNWLASNAARGSVVNFSFGYPHAYPACTPYHNVTMEAAIVAAYRSGITIVAAAGNDNCPINSTPSSLPEVFSVGASDNTDTKATFSDYGAPLDIWAPGVDINVMWGNGTANTASGTSVASPYEAGLVSLFCQTSTECNTTDISGSTSQPGMDVLYKKFRGLDVCASGPPTNPPTVCPTLSKWATPLVINGAGANSTRRFIRLPPPPAGN